MLLLDERIFTYVYARVVEAALKFVEAALKVENHAEEHLAFALVRMAFDTYRGHIRGRD